MTAAVTDGCDHSPTGVTAKFFSSLLGAVNHQTPCVLLLSIHDLITVHHENNYVRTIPQAIVFHILALDQSQQTSPFRLSMF